MVADRSRAFRDLARRPRPDARPGQLTRLIAKRRALQVVATLASAVSHYGYANFSRYPGTTPPGISRNAYGLLGSASVLVELRGVGQKANGYIAKTGYVAGMSVVEALADRSLYTTDITPADALQLAPGNASLFGKCLAPREYTLENYNFCRQKLGLNPVSILPPPEEATPDSDEATIVGGEHVDWSTE